MRGHYYKHTGYWLTPLPKAFHFTASPYIEVSEKRDSSETVQKNTDSTNVLSCKLMIFLYGK